MENIVTVSSLKKAFKTQQVLKGVNFTIRKGSIFALLGSNGAGKTTAVKILSTLSKPDSGTATICGYDVVRQADKVRECISLTGQFAAVDEALTGRENLQLIASLKRAPLKKVDDLLSAFHLEDAANKRASAYSGGMRRRLDIAMSLIGSPKVLFLDEPTTGLDPQNRIAMWDMVKGLASEGTTVLLTTQYLEEAEYLANHIAILHEGIIKTEGTADHLKTILPRSSVQLEFNHIEDAQNACKILKDYVVNATGKKSINVSTDGSAGQFADILNHLIAKNIGIVNFEQKLPSLEDVFLTLVSEK